MQKEFGRARVFNAPIAEDFIVGTDNGFSRFRDDIWVVIEAAQFADYVWPAMEQIVDSSHDYYRSAGQFAPNIVMRLASGGYIGGGLYHSQTLEAVFTSLPGLRVVMPAFADDAVGLLRKFVDEVAKRKEPSALDLLSARVHEPDSNIVAMKLGLLLIADRITAEQRKAEETKLRLGATRKTGTIDARRVAAVGWLGDAVHRITGQPHRPQVAKLANVILGRDAVTEDQVNHATRTRRREWRLPLGRAFARKK